MEAAIALSGQVAGRITEILPVKTIVETMIAEFHTTIQNLNPAKPA
jgi:NAD(P)H-dependent flavin oxidoreductase YrpB (nitropropane dioxygenase family)